MGAWTKEPESLLPTAEPTIEDVIFFAGFYEGEGSACSQKNGGCVVQVPQKDPEVLYHARSLWGGTVRVNSRGISTWVMSGDRGRMFLQAIYPYLSSRRKGQIERAGGLTLTGKTMLSESGMTPERASARSQMSDDERHRETSRLYAQRNSVKMALYAKKWQKENREHLNQLQRERRKRLREERNENLFEAKTTFPERSQLLN